MERLNGYFGPVVLCHRTPLAIGQRFDDVQFWEECLPQPGIILREATQSEAKAFAEELMGRRLTRAEFERGRNKSGSYYYEVSVD